jgi:hypothetical protein
MLCTNDELSVNAMRTNEELNVICTNEELSVKLCTNEELSVNIICTNEGLSVNVMCTNIKLDGIRTHFFPTKIMGKKLRTCFRKY